MGIVAVPLLAAYAAYSLIYDTHKSWYSFIITTLVGSVYAYGFLMMVCSIFPACPSYSPLLQPTLTFSTSQVPSLYINYRLQSVAHMPARAMTYKFLNTFIDDLFAFTIKMPTLHRLATLRDDVVFFVYIYQAWKYRVDYNRVNEFGMGGEEDEKEEKGREKKGDGGKDLSRPLESAPESGEAKAKVVEEVKKSGPEAAVGGGGGKGSARKRKG